MSEPVPYVLAALLDVMGYRDHLERDRQSGRLDFNAPVGQARSKPHPVNPVNPVKILPPGGRRGQSIPLPNTTSNILHSKGLLKCTCDHTFALLPLRIAPFCEDFIPRMTRITRI